MRKLCSTGGQMRMATSTAQGTAPFTTTEQHGTEHCVTRKFMCRQPSSNTSGRSTPDLYS
jgi:hypothetical protein